MGYQKTVFFLVTPLLFLLSLPGLAPATDVSPSPTNTESFDPSDTELSAPIQGNTSLTASVYREGEPLEPTKQGAEPAIPSSWVEVKHSRRGRAYVAFPRSLNTIGVSASLALLMVLLLWISGGQLPGWKPKGPAKPEEEEQAEEKPAEEQPLPEGLSFPVDAAIRSHALWRLGKLPRLLPTAESLSSAVGTEETKLLLRTIRENAAAREREKQLDSDTLMLAVRTSFGGLRRLHQAAIEHAARIAKDFERADAAPLALQLLDEESCLDALAESQRERDALLPLKTVLESIRDDKEELTRRFRKTYTQISTGRVFRDEGDEQRLIAAARDLHRLLAIQTANQRALDTAKALEEQGIAAVKTLVTGDRMKFYRRAKVEKEMAVAQLHLVNERLSKKFGLADERQAVLTVSKTLREIQALLRSFSAGTTNIKKLKNLQEVKQAADEGLEKQEEIQAALSSCWQIISDLWSGNNLEAQEGDSLLSAAGKAERDATELVTDVRRRAKRLRAFRGESGLDESSISSFLFSGTAFDAVASEAKETEERAKRWLEKCREAMTKLGSASTISEALNNIQTLALSVTGIVEAEKTLKMLENRRELFKILQDDIDNTATRAAIAASRASGLSSWDGEQLQQRLELFSASYRRATTAKTLEEAASSAVTMRVLVGEVERLSELGTVGKKE